MREIAIFTLLTLFLHSSATITTTSLQKRVTKSGVVWKKASKVVPGEVIKYVNAIKGDKDLPIKRVVVTNKIPKQMLYISKSAFCQKGCKILFSVDGGKRFATASKLFVYDKKLKRKRRAKTSEYTDIEWIIPAIAPKAKLAVGYLGKLK